MRKLAGNFGEKTMKHEMNRDEQFKAIAKRREQRRQEKEIYGGRLKFGEAKK